MVRNQESGFSVIEVVMAVVIVVLIGAVAYLYVQASQKRDSDATAKNTTSTKSTKSETEAKKSSLNATEVQTNVQAFYDKYIQATYPSEMKTLVAQYTTKSFAAKYNDIMDGSAPVVFDPVFCAQNNPDKGLEVKVDKVDGSRADITIVMNFSGSGTSQFAATVVDENGPKIDSVTCK